MCSITCVLVAAPLTEVVGLAMHHSRVGLSIDLWEREVSLSLMDTLWRAEHVSTPYRIYGPGFKQYGFLKSQNRSDRLVLIMALSFNIYCVLNELFRYEMHLFVPLTSFAQHIYFSFKKKSSF